MKMNITGVGKCFCFGIMSVVLLMLVVCVGGCGRKLPPDLEANLKACPDLKERAVKLETQPIETVRHIPIADLIVAVPVGWKVGAEKEEQTPRQANATFGRLKFLIGSAENKFAVEFCYWQEKSWVMPPNPDTIYNLKARVPDPEALLEQYQTDLDFFQAIYNATPAKVKYAASQERAADYAALMNLKWYLPLPGRRIDGKSFTAYGSTSRKRLVFEFYLFDSEGMLRGGGVLRFPKNMSTDEVETAIGQLLYNSRFSDREDPAAAKTK